MKIKRKRIHEAPRCCNREIDLISAYSSLFKNENVTINVFQCKRCGKVIEFMIDD